jgi:membrane-associated PAP2 superfamily phosphatase
MASPYRDGWPQPHWDHRVLWAGLAALLASALVAVGLEALSIDLAISDLVYDRTSHRWLVDFDRDRWLNRLFYRWPKYLIAALTVALVVLLLAPAAWRRGRPRAAFACVLSFWLFSLTVSALKDRTDVYFPRQLARYQPAESLPPPGQWQAPTTATLRIPYRRLWERFDPPRPPGVPRGRGFPAAHATAGLWLMGLSALATTARWRLGWLAIGSLAGFVLGTYQVLNGGHFMSHTVISWGIACGFLAVLWCLWGIGPSAARARDPTGTGRA